jgi:hypothetical protein
MTDDEHHLPSVYFWSALAAGALISAILIGWLLVAVLP